MLLGRYIQRRGLKNLKHYKYEAAGATFFDKLMNHWWEKAVLLVPLWIAPNVLTLLGFFSALMGFVLMMIYNPSLSGSIPPWLYFVEGLLMFLYQTFDAIDGKQARRTGTSSPLGQLFDHGCDVLVVTAISSTMLGIIGCGVGLPQFLALAISTHLHQFIYMWWEYHFHVFYTATGVIGTTEAQLGMMVCSAMGAIWGTEVFAYDLFNFFPALRAVIAAVPFIANALTVRHALMYGLVLMNGSLAFYNIVVGVKKAKQQAVSLFQVCSFGVFMYVEWIFYRSCLMWTATIHSGWVYYAMSTAYSIVVVRLCLSATCRCEFGSMEWPVAVFYVVTALIYFKPCPAVWPLNSSYELLLILCAWNTIYLADLLTTSIYDICSVLKIACFTIPKKRTKKA